MLHTKKLIRIFIDLLGINLSYFISFYLVFNSFVQNQDFIALWVIVNLLWFSTLSVANKLYGRFEYTTFRKEIESVINNYILHLIGFSIIYFFLFKQDYLFHNVFYVTLALLLPLGRFLLKRFIPRIGGVTTLNYIIIGYCDVLKKVEATINHAHLGRAKYLGSFGMGIPEPYSKIGEVEYIYDYIKDNNVNMILYASNEMGGKEIRKLMNYSLLNFIEFKIIPLEVELLSRGVKMEVHNGYPIISVKDENIARIRNRFLKRIFDIVFSLLVIIFILSWLFPLLSLLIKLESRGPALFSQKRVGHKNNQFLCHKFRSMIVHEDKEVKQATKGDSRITKIGAFMRRTNLDEMPQFFNVLKGNMTVVGPRPHAVSHDIQFQDELKEYILRHYTKPGITGWAQVNGFRGPTDTKEAIEGRTKYDIWYLRNWSFFLDIKIIFLTLFGKKTKENAF